LVVGAVWWRALEPSRVEIAAESREPEHRTITVPIKGPGVPWDRFRVVLKNGDVVVVDGTHYVMGAVLQIKDAARDVAVYTVAADQVGSVSRIGAEPISARTQPRPVEAPSPMTPEVDGREAK
jgi:hypothetical protein